MSTDRIIVIGDELAGVDAEIIELLAKRMDLVRELELLKRGAGAPIIRPDIEEQRMASYRILADEYGISPRFILAIFYHIHAESIRRQLEERENASKGKI